MTVKENAEVRSGYIDDGINEEGGKGDKRGKRGREREREKGKKKEKNLFIRETRYNRSRPISIAIRERKG